MNRGVNLGNWLVLEKWMSPRLFAGTTAEDEHELVRQLDAVQRAERYRVHRDTYITDRDFLSLAARGLDLVRLPVPWFVFGGHEPFVGCIEYVDAAFGWAERYGLRILLDLHTVPGSANGTDNGGIIGVSKFHLDRANVDIALDVLERLAARYRDSRALWGIEVVNEPMSPELFDRLRNHFKPLDPEFARGSEAPPIAFLEAYYRESYERIRAVAPDTTVVFHDSFRIHRWKDFFARSNLTNVMLDTHMYLLNFHLFEGVNEPADFLAKVEDGFGASLAEVSAYVPVLVGEWSLEAPSPQVTGLPAAQLHAFYRALAAAQLTVFDQAAAWTFWAYKLLIDTPVGDIWDLGKAIDLGYLPANFATPRT